MTEVSAGVSDAVQMLANVSFSASIPCAGAAVRTALGEEHREPAAEAC
jgi:hypothetical protein